MKRIIALFLLPAMIFALFSCGNEKLSEITCEEIISAYEKAGYSNIFHLHYDENHRIDNDEKCYIIIHETDDDDSDLVEIKTFYTEEAAKKVADFDKYNSARWIIAAMYGEWRWLKSGQYGRIAYSSYNSELLIPLKNLIK